MSGFRPAGGGGAGPIPPVPPLPPLILGNEAIAGFTRQTAMAGFVVDIEPAASMLQTIFAAGELQLDANSLGFSLGPAGEAKYDFLGPVGVDILVVASIELARPWRIQCLKNGERISTFHYWTMGIMSGGGPAEQIEPLLIAAFAQTRVSLGDLLDCQLVYTRDQAPPPDVLAGIGQFSFMVSK